MKGTGLCGCREDAHRVALVFAPLRADRQLELADLLAQERGPDEGVVLAAAEHVPSDHDQLACDGDGRDVVSAFARDPFGEDAQRPGRPR